MASPLVAMGMNGNRKPLAGVFEIVSIAKDTHLTAGNVTASFASLFQAVEVAQDYALKHG